MLGACRRDDFDHVSSTRMFGMKSRDQATLHDDEEDSSENSEHSLCEQEVKLKVLTSSTSATAKRSPTEFGLVKMIIHLKEVCGNCPTVFQLSKN